MLDVSPSDFVDRALHVPYVEGGGSFVGADCWGIVELYYRHVLGIDLSDRAEHEPGAASVQEWYDATNDWQAVPAPLQHCLVVLRTGHLTAGHVGIYFDGRVLHSSRRYGCVAQPYARRGLRALTTALLVRR